jgi:hypothetical protein
MYSGMQPASRPHGKCQEILQADSAAYTAAERCQQQRLPMLHIASTERKGRCRNYSRCGTPCRANHGIPHARRVVVVWSYTGCQPQLPDTPHNDRHALS